MKPENSENLPIIKPSLKKLPIGKSTLRALIEENYLYVDKTYLALNLIENGGGYYFLSRPRRFGKSLFLDTLRSIFDGDKELFKGLYIYDKWGFEKYPVITLMMSDEFLILDELKNNIKNQLNENAGKYNIVLEDNKPHFMLSRLLRELHKKTSKKVVLLIDDADAPFRERLFDDNLKEIHNFLLGFYITTKDCDEHIKFSMMTGVHPIKGDMLFGFNNFVNISLDKKFGDICGFTQKELEDNFSEHLKLNIRNSKLKEWYNGYKFLGEGVYNPFDKAIYILEFKVDGTNALEQIKEMKYHEKYLSDGRDIYLLGLEFDTKDRNISKLEWEKI